MSTPATAEPPVKTAEELAAEAAAPKPTTEEQQKALNRFARQVLGDKDTPDPKEPEPAPAAAAPATTAAPKAKKKAPPKPAPAPEPIDYGDMIDRTAEATGRAVADAIRPKETPAAAVAEDTSFMTEEEREMIPVLERMETMQPERYKGLSKKYASNLKEVADYQAKWEAENPGEEFDAEDKAHNDFYAKHTVDWRELDEKKAIADIVSEPKLKAEQERTGAKLTELEKREKAREMEPVIFTEKRRVGQQLFDLVGGEFKGVLAPNGMVKADVLAKIQESDPLAADIIFGEVQAIENLAAENYRLFNEVVGFDAKNQTHEWLAQFAMAQENAIMALPKDEQRNAEGKKFAKSSDYFNMSEEKRTSYYRLTVTDLNNLMVAELGQKAVERLESERQRMARYAPKYGFSKADNGNGAPATPPATPPPTREEPPLAVTTTRVPVPAPGANRTNIPSQNPREALTRAILD